MATEILAFISTWAPASASTEHRVELRNVRQGGNDFLAAGPQALQAAWASSVMELVASVALGPISWVAQVFRILFSSFVSIPISIISCAVKEGFYESSIKATAAERITYFERGPEVAVAQDGTAEVLLDGVRRHFELRLDITHRVENSVEIEEEGKTVRRYFNRLRDGEVRDDRYRDIEINGERVVARLEDRGPDLKNYIEREVDGRRRYFQLGNEVAEPVAGTFSERDPANFWHDRCYQIGRELPQETPGCIKIKVKEQTLYYDTGREIAEPQPGSYSFMIDGQLRHFASAKYAQHESPGLSGVLNMLSQKFIKVSLLPTRLSRTAKDFFLLINRHLSNVIRLMLIVSGAVFLYFGHVAMAVGVLAAVSYEYLDHDLGIIPHKVSLFIEKWMPTVAMVGLLIVGSWTSQIMAGASLLFMVPSIQLWVHQKVAKIFRKAAIVVGESVGRWFSGSSAYERERPDAFIRQIEQYPQLEEFEAPLVEQRDLNAAQIQAILEANTEDYEINPACLTKDFKPSLNLAALNFPENTNYDELTRLWDGVGERWTDPRHHSLLLGRAADDKRFILFLQERFPEAKRFYYEDNWRLDYRQNRELRAEAFMAFKNQIDGWIQILAGEKRVSKERFLADWAKEQLQCFVNKLKGDLPIEGEQRYLRDAKENTAKGIIPFLVGPHLSATDIEDPLMKLAFEAGNYCALGMKRAVEEVAQGFIEPLLSQVETDPHKAFENEVKLILQKGRLGIIQGAYQFVTQFFQNKEETQDIGADVHLYEAITRSMKLGIYPLTSEERSEVSFLELLANESIMLHGHLELFKGIREFLPTAMDALAIDRRNSFEAVVDGTRREIPHNRVLNYLRNWVEGNSQLSAEEKANLLNGPLLVNADNLADPDNHKKWNQLLLFTWGFLRKKPPSAARAVERAPAVGPVRDPQLASPQPVTI